VAFVLLGVVLVTTATLTGCGDDGEGAQLSSRAGGEEGASGETPTSGPDTTIPDTTIPRPEGPVPRVWSTDPPGAREIALGAIVRGVLRWDAQHDCLLLEQADANGEEHAYPVVWPAGTVGTNDGPGVVLADGRVARVGDTVIGAGGYFGQAPAFDIPAACLPDTGEIAGFNAGDVPEVIPVADLPEPHRYQLYTHCGIHWARLQGGWWQATTPLDDGNRNPPRGWGNPSQEGTMSYPEPDRAVFDTDNGLHVEFVRTDITAAPFSCD
jgi:hypothetical protein